MEQALKVAIDLLHVPSRVRQMRVDPLPSQMLTVLRIAAGDAEAIESAAAALDRPRRVIEDAASFFIEQVLFSADADSYRVLGADATATIADLRRNMALLLRWVHPDLDRSGARASFATRVSQAWDDLKTPERRQAYDARRASERRDKKMRSARHKASKRQRAANGPPPPYLSGRHGVPGDPSLGIDEPMGTGFLRRALSFLFPRS
jgi:DnaJ domain